MNELIEYAHSRGITSPRKLWYAKYRELWWKHSTLPSHYIHAACRHAASIYGSFIKLKKLEMCKKERPVFKGRVIWLDKQLFKLDAESWRVSISVYEGRLVVLRLLHGGYHERFRGMRPGEVQLVLKEDGR